MRLTIDRVLRALSRYDAATVPEITEHVGASVQRTVWAHLQTLTERGLATKDNERISRYSITSAGRLALKQAA
jgi:DNA-binding IclR family transcriptional regulator